MRPGWKITLVKCTREISLIFICEGFDYHYQSEYMHLCILEGHTKAGKFEGICIQFVTNNSIFQCKEVMEKIKLKASVFNRFFILFVYSKSEYTTKIGQCVRPSVRLFDNFRKESQIVMKFSTQFSLINVSVEFEDEKDPSRNGWVIEKIVIIDQTIPEGGYRDFFKKKLFS